MSPTEFEPTIPARERLQTHPLDRGATGIGVDYELGILNLTIKNKEVCKNYNINAYCICGGVSSSLFAQLISSLLYPVPSTGQESRYELPWPGGPGPDYVVYVFVFHGSIIICLLCKLPLSVQAQDTLQL